MGTLKKPKFEVADVLKQYGERFRARFPQSPHVLRTLDALQKCRTAALGGHVDACSQCGEARISYNSCRNRHCPKCQGLSQKRWVAAREADLLPVPYYHVVFTLPEQLNGLCISSPRAMYDLLFRCAWETVQVFAKDQKFLGAKTGMVAVLHTWGQNLSLHPHVHTIIPGGGMTEHGKWKAAKGKGKFLFPVKAMSKVFRAKFLEGLQRLADTQALTFLGSSKHFADPLDFAALIASLKKKRWVIYAKKPFGGPQQVINYLGRYTHRIAISNHRIQTIGQGKVSFQYKDYRQAAKKKVMTLEAEEFLRRFSMHILPPQFVRLRHYGILASRNKTEAIAAARKSLGVKLPEKPEKQDWKALLKATTGIDVLRCPTCKAKAMHTVATFAPYRAPPLQITSPKTS